MAPLESCTERPAVSAAPGFAGGEYQTQSHHNFKILSKKKKKGFREYMSHTD